MATRPCSVCGTPRPVRARSLPQPTCQPCRRASVKQPVLARKRMTCAGCGEPMWRSSTSLPQGQATCRPCRALGRAPRQAMSGQPKRGRCHWCGYRLGQGQKAYCSVKCSNQRSNDLKCQAVGYGRNPEVRRQSWQAKNRRRRARRRGGQAERYTLAEIASRDRWRCGLCHRRVQPDLDYLDPSSATIDHVVPLSVGGDDTRANVQLAHRACNIRKHNRGSQQLALIG